MGVNLTRREFLSAASSSVLLAEPHRQAGNGVVCSDSLLASQAGAQIMKHGGNAVDAAVATALALAVTLPAAGNLGGGGFMVIRLANGQSEAIDYRERAPAAASRDMYLDAMGKIVPGRSTIGRLGAGVPGTIAGLALAHRKHGKLSWRQVVEPAIGLAQEGFAVPPGLAGSLRGNASLLMQFAESSRIYLREGRPYQTGEMLRQPELAATLERISRHGPRDFYEGETAKLIARDMAANAGLITEADLKAYRPTVRRPLQGSYRGFEIISMPPPSSGGLAMLQMLQMLERWDLAAIGADSPKRVHLLIEVMRRAFADRSHWLGDPDFADVPVANLLNRNYNLGRAAGINELKATPSVEIQHGEQPMRRESKETTHFSVVDASGNAVSNTYTLNGSYGCGVTVPGAGFLLNNEMDDFTSKPGEPNLFGLIQGERNAIQPGKRPLSSMTPTIITGNGKLRWVIGSPGGPTIINTVLQTALNLIDHHMDLQSAVSYTRLHHQWLPDEVEHEPKGMPAATRAELERMGHRFARRAGLLGSMQAIEVDPDSGRTLGALEPRSRDGGVAIA